MTSFDVALLALLCRLEPKSERLAHDGKEICVYCSDAFSAQALWKLCCGALRSNPTQISIFLPHKGKPDLYARHDALRQ